MFYYSCNNVRVKALYKADLKREKKTQKTLLLITYNIANYSGCADGIYK